MKVVYKSVTICLHIFVLQKKVLTHSTPADEVVGVWILHQCPQLGQKGWNIA